VIVLAAWLGLYVWNLGGAEVYAVEQTVEALRRTETVHAFCTDWEGHKFEMWIRPDPATGANDFICLTETHEERGLGFLIFWFSVKCIVIHRALLPTQLRPSAGGSSPVLSSRYCYSSRCCLLCLL
jgi:hypothetical protein